MRAEDFDGAAVCACGHDADTHHIVYWAGGGVSVDECEAYGFNETGGMRETRLGWFFGRVVPYRHSWSKKVAGEGGTARYEQVRYPNRARELLRRVPGLRGPWYVDHCHRFRKREE